jgi:hypothetical protein
MGGYDNARIVHFRAMAVMAGCSFLNLVMVALGPSSRLFQDATYKSCVTRKSEILIPIFASSKVQNRPIKSGQPDHDRLLDSD